MLLEKPDEAKGLTWQGEPGDGYGPGKGILERLQKDMKSILLDKEYIVLVMRHVWQNKPFYFFLPRKIF